MGGFFFMSMCTRFQSEGVLGSLSSSMVSGITDRINSFYNHWRTNNWQWGLHQSKNQTRHGQIIGILSHYMIN